MKTGELKDAHITDSAEFVTNEALEKLSLRLNPVGSVLIAMYGATIGRLGILSIPATTNQACCACIPYFGVFNVFLFYYLMGIRDYFIELGAGGAQPNISKAKIESTLFALPPLPEQHRIVEKLGALLSQI